MKKSAPKRISAPLKPETMHNQFIDVMENGRQKSMQAHKTRRALAKPVALGWVKGKE